MKFNTAILQLFEPVSLGEMDAAELLDRTDTKYVFHISMLEHVLLEIKNDYRILVVNEQLTCRYESRYFDDENFTLYQHHHNGKGNRMKVRYRRYDSTNKFFFEVKNKTNKGRTVKKRIGCAGFENQFSNEQKLMFEKYSDIDVSKMRPSVETDFTRITLVKKDFTERITFDTDLLFSNSSSKKGFDEVVICEVKQSKHNYNSPVIKYLKSKHVMPRSISKYCWGITELNKSIKQNEFKAQLHQVYKSLTLTKINEH